MQSASLKDLCKFLNGGTPSKKRPEFFRGEIPWISSADIRDGSITPPRNHITKQAIVESATNLVPKGTVLLVTRTGVGKVAVAPFDLCFSQDITAVIPRNEEQLHPEYLAYFLLSCEPSIRAQQRGATIQGVTREALVGLKVPLVSKDMQRQIVRRLDLTRTLKQTRATILEGLEKYLHSLFIEMFGDPATNPNKFPIFRLDQITEIGSGITKGKKYGTKQLVEVPYIRVANVQAGYLDLKQIKTIEVAEAEIERYLLKVGDVLMTEGGDWDKLGRGAVWDNFISPCIHQNHIFRVRPNAKKILPFYLDALLQTSYAKSFFQRASKQTTNLATINKTQLSAFPIPLPPIEIQSRFCEQRKILTQLMLKMEKSATELNKLMNSELTESFTHSTNGYNDK
jgi:type I restriction enzyme S subunit